jgi:hypothetical protein
VNLIDVILFIGLMTPCVLGIMLGLKQNGGPTESFIKLSDFFTRVFESIAILFGAPRPVVPKVLTLDDKGMTLWEASEAHYDVKALNRIKQSHQLEHKLWLNFAGEGHWSTNEERELVGLPKKRTPEENMRLGLITADRIEIRNWQGDVVRSGGMTPEQAERIVERANQINADLDDTEDIWDEDADETLLIQQCKNHSRTETCYYCDNNTHRYPKRQRRRK